MLLCQALGRCTHLAGVVMTCRAVHQQQFPSGGIWWVVGVWQMWLPNLAPAQKTTHSKAVNTPAQVLCVNKLIKHRHPDTACAAIQSCMRQGLLLQRPPWFFPYRPYSLRGPTVLFFTIDSVDLSSAGSRLTCLLFLWPEVQPPVQEKIDYNGDRSRSKRSK